MILLIEFTIMTMIFYNRALIGHTFSSDHVLVIKSVVDSLLRWVTYNIELIGIF